ncbi:type VI secretion system contractile sheath protein TssC [Segetibacter sp. 3557_3]|uniref:type VI secretion system contractile sheath protein TssC n=1 Tax=Segetibacter sp. 3557_3 TaxID=2547429 RepID=UPI0010590685|nr:type VI secretion system contractile sheath protein TssC [Segetibacter sp. 3557_3]TDH28061.1 type VI secretion system contractile sheath protein TssC [Segetibacter sp. 3557_3]
MTEEAKSVTALDYRVDTPVESKPELVLDTSLNTLVKAGGFDFLESIIEGVDNLNPVRKARRNIFLTDNLKGDQREDLKKRMELWLSLLEENTGVAEMVNECITKTDSGNRLIKANLKTILERTRELEAAYRSVQLFYTNTETSRVTNVVLINASLNQLTDMDEPRFINFIEQELKQKYDRLDLRQNYSLLVIPGYLKSEMVLNKWAKIAHQNKVMLVTDFANIETPEDVLDMFTDANHTGAEPHKANVMMTCNYIIARGKNEQLGEEDDIYVPGSAALAGKLYATKLSQPVAGKTYGTIDEADTVRFDQKKAEISELENVGLIPFVSEWGKVMPFSAKTLFTGDNLGMQTYSVVRVFDFIAKVVSDFLNRRAFELWNTKMEVNLRSQIVKFLDGIQGPDKLIEKFQIVRFEKDDTQKDHIYLDMHITPFFPAKSFIVSLDGYKGDDGEEWKAAYKQK